MQLFLQTALLTLQSRAGKELQPRSALLCRDALPGQCSLWTLWYLYVASDFDLSGENKTNSLLSHQQQHHMPQGQNSRTSAALTPDPSYVHSTGEEGALPSAKHSVALPEAPCTSTPMPATQPGCDHCACIPGIALSSKERTPQIPAQPSFQKAFQEHSGSRSQKRRLNTCSCPASVTYCS